MEEKKRRLKVEQVRALESSFETVDKLEPERKARLARELGLQPRQVAVWFQNRRARCKTKRLERDYAALKASHDALLIDVDEKIEELEAKSAGVERISFSSVKEEPMDLLIDKGGSSEDSDSSIVLNSPRRGTLSSQMMPLAGIRCCVALMFEPDRSRADKGEGFPYRNMLKMEEAVGVEVEDLSSLFSDEQPTTPNWYYHHWN